MCLRIASVAIFLLTLIAQLNTGDLITITAADYECGLVEDDSTDAGKYPWTVAIFHIQKDNTGDYACVGNLISRNFVLTVAHCLVGLSNNIVRPPEIFGIYLGAAVLNKFNPNAQILKVDKVHIHEKFTTELYHNDIGVLKLQAPVQITKYVRPICLWPANSTEINDHVGRIGIAAGWGFDGERKFNDKMQIVPMPIADTITCLKSDPGFYSHYLTKTGFCAGFRNGTSLCNGLSGVGLAYRNENNVWEVRGVASLQKVDKGSCDRFSYTVFSDVEKYREWIISKTEGDIERIPNPIAFDANTCGVIPTRGIPFIHNGQDAAIEDWPWHVALYRLTEAQFIYSCGGTLLSNRFVITAAHCLAEESSRIAVNPRDLQINLGVSNLKKLSKGVQFHFVNEIHIHPLYNETRFYNDIGLVKLQQEVQFTEKIRSICLWQNDLDISKLVGIPGTIVGFGYDTSNTISDQLKVTKYPVVKLSTCFSSDRLFFYAYIFDNNYCAGYMNGTSACNGDSGGGMYFQNNKTGIWELRGVVSVGSTIPGTRNCNPKHFTLFTDVAKYLPWINLFF